jgi:hypothetical protein
MTLMKEAYADAAKDKNLKDRSYDIDPDFSYGKLEEAYRTGNLDLLDTINKVNSTSAAFDEKFLYKRNEIQAASIDSILQTKASLFAGVGAAHLPGDRGVIEMLRQKGYHLRPVQINKTDRFHKEAIEKLRVPVSFSKYTSADGFFSVNLPGKLYSFSNPWKEMDQQQYADMSNGSYYMVSRIYTNAAMWAHDAETVRRKTDSLLYMNIPGKIISKKNITKNGYSGFEIINRTRRGDYQHYNIFITPFEVIIFKMSGNGDYVTQGTEAATFFNSIRLQSLNKYWQAYAPKFGGFTVQLPHPPVVSHFDTWKFTAADSSTGTNFQITRADIHNLRFVEEDSFDLNLMEESFSSSAFIDTQTSRTHLLQNGYPALQASYKYKDGSVALVKFIIQGAHYYTLVSNAKTQNEAMLQFINSFAITPFVYSTPSVQTDTLLHFVVHTPVAVEKEKKLSMYPEEMSGFGSSTAADDEYLIDAGNYKDRLIENDATGEKIYVSFYKSSRYSADQDSTMAKDTMHFKTRDQDWLYRSRKAYTLPNKTNVLEFELYDAGSSRVVRGKTLTRDGIRYAIAAEGDSLTQWSSFVDTFFNTFTPVNSELTAAVSETPSSVFFNDFFSTDTLQHKRAIKNVQMLTFDSTSFAQLKTAILSLGWKEKKYLDVKNGFLSKLSDIPTKAATDFLKETYYAATDTVDMQYTVLHTLLAQHTAYAYNVFQNIMVDDPPVLNISSSAANNRRNRFDDFDNSDFLNNLKDSLLLTKTIFPGLLPLITINDYEQPMMDLLETMVDSNMIAKNEYAIYLPKLLIEAKQEMKKQVISEKTKAIAKAQKDDDNRSDGRSDYNWGNRRLSAYAILLMPFWQDNKAMPALFQQMLRSSDERLQYNTALLMIRYNKPVADSILQLLAANDLYCFELYTDLKTLGRLDLFPGIPDVKTAILRSKLIDGRNYSTLDSIVYLAQLPVTFKEREGLIYFFKYRQKKDDIGWKIGMSGLAPVKANEYVFDNKGPEENAYNFTELTTTKLEENEPLEPQLRKVIKTKLYSKRKSSAFFYQNENGYNFGNQ